MIVNFVFVPGVYLFRLFAVIKLLPIPKLETFFGENGIVLDDGTAGLYTFVKARRITWRGLL